MNHARLLLLALLATAALLPAQTAATQATGSQATDPQATGPQARQLNFGAAAKVSAKQAGLAVVVYRDDELLFEDYHNGHSAEKSQHIFSGTKSFAPILALIMEERGWLTLDEPVHKTITEWADDPVRSLITVRHLLDFTSGLEINDRQMHRPSNPDWYGTGLAAKGEAVPGTRFRYGSSHLMVFGELIKRKLASHRPEDNGGKPWPKDFAEATEQWVLAPIGARVDRWLRDRKGNPAVPFGAYMTAREWAKFGRLLLHKGTWHGVEVFPGERLAECLRGSKAQPAYGLNFWLANNRLSGLKGKIPQDTFMAVGMFTQLLYVIPSENLVIVRLGASKRSSLNTRAFHEPFLTALFGATRFRDGASSNPDKPTSRPTSQPAGR